MAPIPSFQLPHSTPSPSWNRAGQRVGSDGNVNAPVDMARVRHPFAEEASPFDKLPEPARERVAVLQRAYDDLRSLGRAHMDEISEVQLQLSAARQQLAVLTDRGASMRAGDGNIYPDHHPSVQQATALVAKHERKLAEIEAASSDRKAKRHVVGTLFHAIEAYAAAHGGQLSLHKTPPKPKTGLLEGKEGALRRLRSEREALVEQLRSVHNAPASAAERKAAMRHQITKLAESGEPVIGTDGSVRLPETTLRAQVMGHAALPQQGQAEVRATSYTPTINAPAVFAWLHRDALIKRLEAEIDATSSGAMTAEQRAKKERELKDAILSIERQEVMLAEDVFLLRPDTDPRAFLLCEGPEPEGLLG